MATSVLVPENVISNCALVYWVSVEAKGSFFKVIIFVIYVVLFLSFNAPTSVSEWQKKTELS